MQFFPTTLRVSVRGSDRNADGVLEDVQLPCPPSVGLYLSDVYTRGSLYVDQPTVSTLTGKWTAWCSVIDEDDMTAESIAEQFVGEWTWTFMERSDDDEPDDDQESSGTDPDPKPSQSQDERRPPSDEKYDQALKALLQRQHKTPGDQ